jgi:prolyl oligopeptidase
MVRSVRFVVLAVAFLVLLHSAGALAQGKPPVAPVREVTDTYFGVSVRDPYRYFEKADDPEAVAWMKAQADHTRTVLDSMPGRKALLARIEELGDAAPARVWNFVVNADHLFYLERKSDENIGKLWVRPGAAAKPRLLVDPDKRPHPEGKHLAIDWFVPSLDNRFVAVGISVGGSEESSLHVIDVATGKDTGDVIDRVNFGASGWTPDGRLLYNRLQKVAPGAPVTDKYVNSKVYRHVLGTDPEKDVALLGPGVTPGVEIAPAALSFVMVDPVSRHAIGLVSNGVQREITLYTAPVAEVASGSPAWRKVVDPADGVTDFSWTGDQLFLVSHQGAPRFKLLRRSLADPAAAPVVVVPQSDHVIVGSTAAKDALYVKQMKGGMSRILRVPLDGKGKPKPIPLPFQGDVPWMASDVRVDGIWFDETGWVRYGGIYRFDPATRKTTDTGLQPRGRFDEPKDVVATEVTVKSHDGVPVPLSIIHRKGLKRDGRSPTMLYGYGAYGISQLPRFNPANLAWMERGGILAVAHVRGGGENGQEWYEAGKKGTKPNTWKDAIACGQWLVAQGYTKPPLLSIRGGSAGGIFVGRSITDRPDLFGAALDHVPMSDVVRTEFSANGVPNIPEFGSVATEEGFRALYAMSPYHWVKDGVPYPAVLVTTGANDPRVDAWQAAKMAARLQAATSSGKPVLLRIDYDAGHGMGSTKRQGYEETADSAAFLLWQAGVKEFQPR